ncbi:MAG: hypothetical protein NZ700_15960 [Gemmataceae bacterium]|nr:hypothetical protein [Gemmataceae bacterium]MDW8264622.1 hypothetical protein [Gemmataceae bacterium]
MGRKPGWIAVGLLLAGVALIGCQRSRNCCRSGACSAPPVGGAPTPPGAVSAIPSPNQPQRLTAGRPMGGSLDTGARSPLPPTGTGSVPATSTSRPSPSARPTVPVMPPVTTEGNVQGGRTTPELSPAYPHLERMPSEAAPTADSSTTRTTVPTLSETMPRTPAPATGIPPAQTPNINPRDLLPPSGAGSGPEVGPAVPTPSTSNADGPIYTATPPESGPIPTPSSSNP